MSSPNRKKKTLIAGSLIALAVLLIGGLAAVRGSLPTPSSSNKIQVAATIFPLADIVREIGGEYVEVELIVPPGVSEHNEALTPQQLAALQSTQTIFAIGQGLDDKLVTQLERSLGNVPVVTVDRNITLHEFGEDEHEGEPEAAGEEEHHHDTGIDPHYWLTVPNAKLIAQTVSATLQELDPENSTHYNLQTTTYLQQLDELEQELQIMTRSASQKQFIAMHNAWSYFADHYGFELVATYEPIEGQEPTVADIQHLQEIITEHGLQTFYSEPQKQTSAATRFLREDLGLTIKVLDPVGGIGGRDSYIELMRANMQTLTN